METTINQGINKNLHIDTTTEGKEMKFYETNKRYLAEALGYIGFQYYKFNDNNITAYSFKNSKELQEALKKLISLRQEYNINKK